LLEASSQEDLYVRFSSNWQNPGRVLLQPYAGATLQNLSGGWPKEGEISRKFMFADLTHYLPDTILVKVDKASMAVSLESRAPFLDHRLVELSLRISPSLMVRDGIGKRPLRELLARFLPAELFDRPKSGFSMPVGRWLRGDLKEWAGDLLSEQRIRSGGYFVEQEISRTWNEHIQGKRDNHVQLWNVLTFEAWRANHSQ